MIGGLFKLGNDDFHETLPKTVIFAAWLQIVFLSTAAVMCFVALAGTVLEALGTMLAIFIFVALGINLLCMYIVFWAARTGNKCWLIVVAVCCIFSGVDQFAGIMSTSAFEMMDAFPVLGIMNLLSAVVSIWIGVLCAMASGKAKGGVAPATTTVVVVQAAP